MNKILILFILLNLQCIAQWQNINNKEVKFEFNTSLESTLLLGEKNFNNIIKKISYSDIYPVSLYLAGLIYFTENFASELKTGLVFGGDYYSGIEYGAFLRYYLFDQKYYTSLGIIVHQNFGVGHGTMISVSSTSESVNYLGLKIAYKPKTYFAFTLGYYYPLSYYPLFTISEANADSYTVGLENVVKLGFEFSF